MPEPLSAIRNSIGMELVLIPAGEFMMGSDSDRPDEKPLHQVIISKPFYLGKYEVTQTQWQEVMGTNPSHFKGNPNRLVERVSWTMVQEFIADFRSTKLTHIPHRQLHRFSRNLDALCEVIFHLIGPRATPFVRGHHLIIASKGLAELPGRRVQWLYAMPRGNRENTSHWSFRVPGTPSRIFAPL
jgi:hypothetical protein